MENSLVFIEKNEPYVLSSEIANGFGVTHQDVTKLIDRYKDRFEELGVIGIQIQKPTSKKGGRPTENYKLNEQQAVFLGTMIRNTDESLRFKMNLTKQFFKQREFIQKIILQKQNAEWLSKRESGKIERRIETDTIKEFVEYAKAQGSKSADKYYMIITKMENQTLFALDFMDQKFPNLREVLDGFALDYLKMADYAVSLVLKDGMKQKTHYKEIYIMARDRIELFASVMGKTPLRLMVKDKKVVHAIN